MRHKVSAWPLSRAEAPQADRRSFLAGGPWVVLTRGSLCVNGNTPDATLKLTSWCCTIAR